uniref:Venom S1 protease with CUB domain 12 n=1 Tax=Oncocephalus sp. TaxID=2944721 RepID=A0AB38ZEQ5_9HEMI
MISAIFLVVLIPTLVVAEVQDVTLTADEFKMQNPAYPEQAPAGLDLTWNFSVEPAQTIVFKCFDLSTTRPTEWDPCGQRSVMILDDGSGEQTLCGRFPGYYMFTKGSKLTVKFRSGPSESGRYSCTVRANVKVKTETKEIQLEDNKVMDISGDAVRFAELTWHVINEPGTQIKLICDSMNTYQTNPCSTDKIIIEDKNHIREYCGSQKAFLDTKSTWITIKLITDEYPGHIRCSAAKIRPVEDEFIHLELGQPAYTDIIKRTEPFFNKTWTFTTSPGNKIAISCPDLRYGGGLSCNDDFYAVNDGTQEIIGCRTEQDKTFFSAGQRLTFRVQSGRYGSGIIHCLAQAVDGPNADHYQNIVSEEVDSSEFGLENGPRQTNCRCGWANKGARSAARILRGQEAKLHEFPWMVGIRDSTRFYFCGGSIITHWHVLTATHCLYEKENEPLFVVIGEHDITREGESESAIVIKVAKRYMASGYSNTSYTNDIAVLALSKKIEFNQHVGPICLTPNRINLDNQYILVMGWGTTLVRYQSPTLQKAYVRVVDINVCDAKYSFSLKRNGDYHKVCYHSKTSDGCQGDSGGPLVWVDPETNRYTQISLVSYSHACGHESPSVSVEVSYFYNWIQSVIRDTYPEEMTCSKI